MLTNWRRLIMGICYCVQQQNPLKMRTDRDYDSITTRERERERVLRNATNLSRRRVFFNLSFYKLDAAIPAFLQKNLRHTFVNNATVTRPTHMPAKTSPR